MKNNKTHTYCCINTAWCEMVTNTGSLANDKRCPGSLQKLRKTTGNNNKTKQNKKSRMHNILHYLAYNLLTRAKLILRF